MESIRIRQLDDTDAAQFQPLRLAALREAPHAFGSSYEEEYLVTPVEWARRLAPTPSHAVFGAFSEATLVGCAGLTRGHHLKQSHKATIWGVYVAPAQRGTGTAGRLMHAAIAHARKMAGLRQLLLTVADGNPAARRLYLGLGFAAFGLEVHRRFGETGAELIGANAPLYLLEKPEGSAAARGAGTRSYARHWTPVHLDFEVPDAEAAVARAVQAGAVLEDPLVDRPWGRIAMLADPFGNGLCIMQFVGQGYDAVATLDNNPP